MFVTNREGCSFSKRSVKNLAKLAHTYVLMVYILISKVITRLIVLDNAPLMVITDL